MIAVRFFEIVKRLVKYNSKLEIFENGEDNAYPELTGRLISNSITAKMASRQMVKYLIGKGFGVDRDKLIINSEENISLIKFAKSICKQYADNRGVYIHVNYELDQAGRFVRVNPKVLPFDWCRLGKEDDNKYSGKIHVKTDWRETKQEPVIFDVYNTNQKVIKAQVEEAGSIEKYKGQIFYYNEDDHLRYPESRIDAVMNDCDSEAQSSVYSNQILRRGFFGKTLIVTRPLIDTNLEEYNENEHGERVPNRDYAEAQSEADEVRDNIEDFMGAENAGGCMVVELDNAGDSLESAILVKNIEANIEPDMFKTTEESVQSKILMAYNNLPVGLVRSNQGIFATGGEALRVMKETYWENTEEERATCEMILNMFSEIILPGVTLEVGRLIEMTQQQPTQQ